MCEAVQGGSGGFSGCPYGEVGKLICNEVRDIVGTVFLDELLRDEEEALRQVKSRYTARKMVEVAAGYSVYKKLKGNLMAKAEFLESEGYKNVEVRRVQDVQGHRDDHSEGQGVV